MHDWNYIKAKQELRESMQRAYNKDLKFIVKFDSEEEIYNLNEESTYDELFMKIHANHPEKADYFITIKYENYKEHIPETFNEWSIKKKSSFSNSLDQFIKNYEEFSETQKSFEIHISVLFIKKPKFIIQVYHDKPSEEFISKIRDFTKKSPYTELNINSSYSKLTKKEGEQLLIVTDDTFINQILSEELNTMDRLIVISKSFDDKSFKAENKHIACLKIPDPSKIICGYDLLGFKLTN